jgi:hypothetical protein
MEVLHGTKTQNNDISLTALKTLNSPAKLHDYKGKFINAA